MKINNLRTGIPLSSRGKKGLGFLKDRVPKRTIEVSVGSSPRGVSYFCRRMGWTCLTEFPGGLISRFRSFIEPLVEETKRIDPFDFESLPFPIRTTIGYPAETRLIVSVGCTYLRENSVSLVGRLFFSGSRVRVSSI